jgi:hypothetical protein
VGGGALQYGGQMVAALLLDGYEAISVVEGLLDGELFFNFIVNEVVCFHNYSHLYSGSQNCPNVLTF